VTVINSELNSTYYLTTPGNPLIINSTGGVYAGPGYAAVDALQSPNALIINAGGLIGGSAAYEVAAAVGVTLSGGTLINSGFVAGGQGYSANYYESVGAAAVTALDFVQVTNSGVIAGGNGGDGNLGAAMGGVGLQLQGGGELTNTGRITGGDGGTAVSTGFAGYGGYGATAVVLGDVGSVTNENGGTIRGGNGGSGYTTGGKGGNGIIFDSTGTLVNGAGSSIIGGTGGYISVGGYGVVLKDGGSITDAGLIEGGADSGRFGRGGIGVALYEGGTVTVESGGTIAGGAATSTAPGGAIGITLNGGTLITAGTISAGAPGADSVYFTDQVGKTSTMIVSSGAVFNGGIGGFRYGDSIDLTHLALSVVEGEFNATTDTIATGNEGTLVFGNHAALLFSSDGDGGTLITCACFRRGTQITTEHGERPIESLQIGDRVLTKDLELKPIRWIGRRHYAGSALIGRHEVLPVLVQSGALGDQLPRRDLWVSPEHALYLKGALVPASLLTNEVSILTDTSVHSVTYYHLEFCDQEVIFAEGAPAESFVDDDSRRMFDNAADYARRYPDAAHRSPTFCAPRIEEGEPLEVLRAQLAEIAGFAPLAAGTANPVDLSPRV
jgi:hypothetical protein